MKQTNRLAVTIAAMLGTGLAALDTTVVGTAMPNIIGQLGGISFYSWVFSAYLLTSTATVPVFGKLADIFGRKPMFLLGTGLFLLGSALCGMAQNIEQLIVFRGIQGIGAGAVLPITLTIIGDIYSIEERAKVQGVFSSVWGVASVIGPAVGGFLTDFINWRWVFYVNVPVGLLAAVGMAVFLHERVEHRRRSIDYVGSVSLMIGISALMFALQQGGTAYPWTSPVILTALGITAALLALFVWNEQRVPEPMLPFSLFRIRVIAVSSVAVAMAGIAMFGVTSYLPLFLQGVQGKSAFAAGAILTPMSLAWPVTSTISGRYLLRVGYRTTGLIGMGLVFSGTVALLFVNATTPEVFTTCAMILVGAGMGCGTSAFLISVQNSVDWSQRGVATAISQFSRTIGGALGVAVMGGLLNARMGAVLAPSGEAAPVARGGLRGANALLEPASRATLSPDALAALTATLDTSLHVVFMLTVLAAGIGLAAAWFFPAGRIRTDAQPARATGGPRPASTVATAEAERVAS